MSNKKKPWMTKEHLRFHVKIIKTSTEPMMYNFLVELVEVSWPTLDALVN